MITSNGITRRQFLNTATVGASAIALSGCANVRSFPGRERPNILWLCTEDSCEYEFGPYGNRGARTPNVDALARDGVTFTHACSTGTQCSPARSSLITGCYATTYGMDYHRGKVPVPDGIFFPERLRAAGYFCTNCRKTDYNAATENDGCEHWDVCEGRDGMRPDEPQEIEGATYENPRRRSGQPFFSVFNYFGTHMSSVRSCRMAEWKRDSESAPDPAEVNLPPHVPDLPEVRSDYARHLDRIEGMDKWVGDHLANLERLGLRDDTIVFFFADNGGCLPRGKGFVFETGHHVPMVVYVPPKWRHVLDLPPGSRSDRLVSFVDLAPTVLSLAGAAIPERMQGDAFMGHRKAPAPELQFGFTTNSGDHYVPTRSASDGRFKLVHSYVPYKPESLRNFFQWGMPANLAWDDCVLKETCQKDEWLAPFNAHPAERLFDTEVDPFEINDLANDPRYAEVLATLRRGLSAHLRETGDLGFFPPSMRDKGSQSLYAWVRENGFPLQDLIEAAELAGAGDPENRSVLIGWLTHQRPEFRFWGASGFAALAEKGQGGDLPPELLAAMDDEDSYIGSEAALAVCYYGRTDLGLPVLMDRFETGVDAFNTLIETRPELRRSYHVRGWVAAYSALETLSLDARFVPEVCKLIPRLEAMQKGYKKVQRDTKLYARSILVNLGEIPVANLYGLMPGAARES